MTTGSHNPSFNARPAPRRSATPKIAGVAEGLGDAIGLDPSLVRIAFAALAFASGAGAVLYLGAWLLMLPPHHPERSGPSSEAIGERPTPALIFGGVLLGIGLLVGLLTLDGFDWLPAVIIGLTFVGIVLLNRTSEAARLLLNNDGPMPPPPIVPPPPTGQAPPQSLSGGPQAPSGGPQSLSGGPKAPNPVPPPPPPPVAPAPPPDGPTAAAATGQPPEPNNEPETAEQWDIRDRPAGPGLSPAQHVTENFIEQDIRDLENALNTVDFGELGGQSSDVQDDLTRAHWALTKSEHDTTLTADESFDPGPPLASITLAALAMLTGLGLIFNTLIGETVRASTLAGIGTAIVGAALMISAYTGRTGRLVPIAIGSVIVLLLSPFLDFALRDGIGSSEIRVSALETLDDEYRQGIGYLGLRLDDLELTEDTVIDVHVGIGAMEITVPADVPVELRGRTEIGNIFLLDAERSGIDQRFTRIPQGREDTDSPRLIINAETIIGEVAIYRARGG